MCSHQPTFKQRYNPTGAGQAVFTLALPTLLNRMEMRVIRQGLIGVEAVGDDSAVRFNHFLDELVQGQLSSSSGGCLFSNHCLIFSLAD